ncbi:hypothetical protein JOF56_009962 [Kibdelosporangium banguiense]|uniref:CHAP domain-containing protein n=1 Tax=Kibdelosporangium banguiense TaxID=1365924 RepID=A0ABS4TYU3_9PSEU|nr:hypothetical protein [Kibdelosporangium banguiense]MBP2329577.1 hypothetical protein [Kibdelosporangium banguiense]
MKKMSVVVIVTLSLTLPSIGATASATALADAARHSHARVSGHLQSVVSSSDICPRTDGERLCADAPSVEGVSRRGVIDRQVPHQQVAEELVDHLNAIGWPRERRYNRYRQGSEETEVRWGRPERSTTYKNVSQCASFVTKTLTHTYSWAKPIFFKENFGKYSPRARDYYDAIADNDNSVPHFTRINKITDLQPGDLIAIKYPESKKPTGHVMLVRRVKGRYGMGEALDGRRPYVVEIIDTTKNAHGSAGPSGDGAYPDTRINGSTKETGAGYGHMLFYADENGTFAGYQWSVSSHRIVRVDDRPVVAARITP